MLREPGILGLALLGLLLPGTVRSGDVLRYVDSIGEAPDGPRVIIDSRPLPQCSQRSLPGARCLPAADFTDPRGRLASFRDILWVFGTAGLSGMETVLVIGEDPVERDFVAGLLFLGGQRRVLIFRHPLSREFNAAIAPEEAGQRRGMLRDPVYQATVRDELIVLSSELRHTLSSHSAPVLLDGRSPADFRGNHLHAPRPGHIPGAQSLPAQGIRASQSFGGESLGVDVVAYHEDAMHSIAYFVMLLAHDVNARVLLRGYQHWAARDDFPVTKSGSLSPDHTPGDASMWVYMGLALIGGAFVLIAVALYIGRRRRWT